jgi:hypothetical protein
LNRFLLMLDSAPALSNARFALDDNLYWISSKIGTTKQNIIIRKYALWKKNIKLSIFENMTM